MAHVVLVGEMGVGKTTLGRLLAGSLGRPFHDSDELLEAATGKTAAQIAATQGVPALHSLELEVFLEVIASSPAAVIAAASSVVDDPRARSVLGGCETLWLTASPDVLTRRRGESAHRRPIDEGDAAALAVARQALLEEMNVMPVDTSGGRPSELVRELTSRLEGTGWLG